MTVLVEETDLSWVQFAEPANGMPCQYKLMYGGSLCGQEALWWLTFHMPCGHNDQVDTDLGVCDDHKVHILKAEWNCLVCYKPVDIINVRLIRE